MNKELLNKAISHLVIQDVYLRECRIWQREGHDPKDPKYPIAEVVYMHRFAKYDFRNSKPDGQDKVLKYLRAHYETVFRVLPPRGSPEMAGVDLNDPAVTEEHAFVSARALFIAEYFITDNSLEEDAIKEFCVANVGYHVTPYWRELAQSIGIRLRLPPIIPPLYVLPPEARPTSNSIATPETKHE